MPTKDRDRPKICHCRGDCNRLLGLRQRKYHYQLVNDPSTICRSTTPSDNGHDISGDDEQTDSSKKGSVAAMVTDDSGDIEMTALSDDSVERDDTGQEAGDGFFDWSDEENWEFHHDNEFNEPLLSLNEIQEALEDAIGPRKDLEMWNLRKSKFH